MAGGGRKQTVEIKDKGDIDEIFLSILKEHTAGDPMDEKVKWTHLTKANIAALLAKKGFKVSRNIVNLQALADDTVLIFVWHITRHTRPNGILLSIECFRISHGQCRVWF